MFILIFYMKNKKIFGLSNKDNYIKYNAYDKTTYVVMNWNDLNVRHIKEIHSTSDLILASWFPSIEDFLLRTARQELNSP